MSTLVPNQPSILDTIQAILENGRAVDLHPRDIALLVLMKHHTDNSSEAGFALTFSEIRALHSRIDAIEARDPQYSERRLGESLSRLGKAECLARLDLLRLGASLDSEYQITPIGDSIAEWNLAQSTFTGEPLTAIFRGFISQLGKIAEDAQKAECRDDWYFDVTQQMRHALKAMLVAIQRHQKLLDHQHQALRDFVPTLLTQGSEGAIRNCEMQLAQVITTIGDLQEAVLASTSASHALIDQIADRARLFRQDEVRLVCGELSRRLFVIAEWTTQRAIDWIEHHNVVHSFLRTVIRVDRERRVTDALKRAISRVPSWSIEIVSEPSFVRMREDELAPPARKSSPRISKDELSRDRHIDDIAVDKLPEIIRQLVMEHLATGEARGSSVLRHASEATGAGAEMAVHLPWLLEFMSTAGVFDHQTRHWTDPLHGLMIQEMVVRQ